MNHELQALSDNDLVAVIKEGRSEVASTELFQRYSKKIYIWCFNMTHDREDAVDLTQEVFMRVFRGLSGFTGQSLFSTWVFSVTRNHCLSVVGTRKDQWRKRLAQLDEMEIEDRTFLNRLDQAEITGQVDQLLQTAGRMMKDNELDAFVLHYRDGLSVKEITKFLGCTNASGARSLIQNAQRKFRRLIERKDQIRDS